MNSFKSKIRSLGFVLLISLVACVSLAVNAQTLSPLTLLYDLNGQSDGATPCCVLVQGKDGWFYGTCTESGPSNPSQNQFSAGTIFRISSTGVIQQLYAFPASWQPPGTQNFFDAPNGGVPEYGGGLVQASDTNFYGTCYQGGAYDQNANGPCGTVFEMDTNGNLTTLWNFTGDTVAPYTDGGSPCATLVQGKDGYLYGTTSGFAGANPPNPIGGTIFKIYSSPSTRQITTLYSFTGGSDGNLPSGLVLGSDGNFYGTTALGGQSGYGTIFKFTTNSSGNGGSLTTLLNFNGTNGNMNRVDAPLGNGLIQGSDGYFYGTTMQGGSHNGGTVFRFNTTNNSLTTLYNFTGGKDGSLPKGTLVQGSDGNLYGQCSYGDGNVGTQYGTVFVITLSGRFTTLYAFNNTSGAEPEAGLAQGSDGNLYGVTAFGGLNGTNNYRGIIFKFFPVGHRWGITNIVTVANSGTWTCPSNIYYATVECWGAGGGGGSATNYNASGGGGGGAYSKGNVVQTIPNYSYGGLVGSGGGADTAGGNTAFPNLILGGNLVEAFGGTQGAFTAGGQGGQASAGIGDVTFSGGNGAAPTYTSYGLLWSGPGGGGAGNTGSGGNAPPGYNSTGGSGTSLYGGNGGNGWELNQGSIVNDATGGAPYGGGGAGAIYTTWPATSGADGLMQISY